MKRLWFLGFLLGPLLMALLGCPPPDGDNGGWTISGKVYDFITGAGISGATVVFGDYSDTTDTSGAYLIEVPESVSSVEGVFAAFKGLGYRFRVCGSITVDPTTNPVFDIGLYPSDDTTGYTNRNLSGKVYDKTPAEIGDGSEIRFGFFNENGGGWWSHANYVAGIGYSTSTKSYGSNCFVMVDVHDESGDDLFQFYTIGQNLSADLTNYDHTQPSTGFTTVTLNGSLGSSFHGYLVVPSYGWISYVRGDQSLSSTATLELYNPENYPMCWETETFAPDTPGPGDTTMWSNSVTLPFSAEIKLPDPYTHAAPSETVDGATANWDGSTLSFDPAAGANVYLVVLEDNTGYRGVITMNSSSITFPVELVTTVLVPGAGWDMQVMPAWSPQGGNADQALDFTLRLYRGEGGPIMGDSQGAMVQPKDATKADIIP